MKYLLLCFLLASCNTDFKKRYDNIHKKIQAHCQDKQGLQGASEVFNRITTRYIVFCNDGSGAILRLRD